MLFPELRSKRFGYLNLDAVARQWLQAQGVSESDPNPLLDPSVCEGMIRSVHEELGLDFSYGGWMEDRQTLWRGSYLDREQTYVHLGLDVNVPAGTEVATDVEGDVVSVLSDVPEEGGWGTRIVIQPVIGSEMLVYAHLDPAVRCRVGDHLIPGDAFARVGAAPFNGGWFSHLHVQCVDAAYFAQTEAQGLLAFDGYGRAQDRGELSHLFGDPMRFLSLT